MYVLLALLAPDRGPEMATKPKIETELSEEDLKAFRHLMATGRCSIDDLVSWLGKRGYEISRSSVGRYSQNFERVAARLRESRQITEAITTELGDAAVQGKQGRLLVEMTRTLVFDMLMKFQEEDAELDTKDVMMLGKGLAELGKALRLDQDFETKLREQIRDAVDRKLETVESELGETETSDPKAVLKRIREEVYGIIVE